MATNDNPRPLSAIVGESLRKFRESRGIRQEDIAEEARKYGFNWGRSSVAALEAGNRDLSVSELLMLPSIVKKLGGWAEPLVPTTANVQINESLWMPAAQIPSHVLSLLAPTARPEKIETSAAQAEDETFLLGGVEDADFKAPNMQREIVRTVMVYELMYRKLWPERSDAPWRGMTSGIEVSRKIADRLTSPDGARVKFQLVQAFSLGMWGRTAGDERDARAAARGTYETKRALQSARGHVTRELIDELQAEITRRWPEVVAILEDMEQALATEEGFKEWQKEFERAKHPDRDGSWDDGLAPPSGRGVHRKRGFLRSR